MLERSLRFANQLQLTWPLIIQAPMAGGITTPELVSAVSNASGLGSYATGYLTATQVEADIKRIKQLTHQPFSANVFVPNPASYDQDQAEAYCAVLNKLARQNGLAEVKKPSENSLNPDHFYEIVDVVLSEKVPVISFVFGQLPENIIAKFKKNGVFLVGTATTLQEAKLFDASQVDAIVVQGYEAGGHRGGFFFTRPEHAAVGTMALIPRIVDAVKLPVIAAGGIMDARGIIAALSLGASAVQMGTAFLATKESGANPLYKSSLMNLHSNEIDPTTLTTAYSGKAVRAIRNDFVHAIEMSGVSMPPYPIANALSGPLRKEAAAKGKANIMSMWAGQGGPMIKGSISAPELLQQLREDIATHLESIKSYGGKHEH